MLQVALLKTAAEEHLLLFNMHHIISDGWSMGILVSELGQLYTACASGDVAPLSVLPVLDIQYKDYAAWQSSQLEEESTIGALRNYWKTQLHALPTLDLPTDYVRPLVKSYSGARVQHVLPLELSNQLQALSEGSGASLFMTLTALVNLLLYRYTGQQDIVLGTPSAGRRHPALHDQIGFYINTLVLRTQMEDGMTFEELLAVVKTTSLAAFEHELYPFDRLWRSSICRGT